MTRGALSRIVRPTRLSSVCWSCRTRPFLLATQRTIHSSLPSRANPLPLSSSHPGPPPPAPKPLQDADNSKSTSGPSKPTLTRRQIAAIPKAKHERFWEHVHIKQVDGRYQVHLDARPLRTPSKHIINIPANKPLLAHALQIEWALMRSSAEALKSHFIPLTSLIARAIDLEEAENTGNSEALQGNPDEKLKSTRKEIVDFLMGYLDTDTVLLISPTRGGHLAGAGEKQLRDRQLEVAQDMITWVADHIPVPEGEERVGLQISDGDHGLLPVQQSDRTRGILKEFITNLSTWDLVGLERAVILGKSLLVGLRLVVENGKGGSINWDVEEAAIACNLETDFQIEQWGLVEDTHDVNHADLRRGLGSVALLVSEIDIDLNL